MSKVVIICGSCSVTILTNKPFGALTNTPSYERIRGWPFVLNTEINKIKTILIDQILANTTLLFVCDL